MDWSRSARYLSVILILVTASYVGCDPSEIESFVSELPNTGAQENDVAPNYNSNQDGQLSRPAIIVGSFNIQSFGRTKIGKPEVMNVLVDIVHRFDILAIQELRDVDQRVIPEFLQMINRGGHHYRASVGPRQGYVVAANQRRYEEQMVYIYDADRIEIIGPTYVAHDRYQQMHRPPYVAHFRCRQVPAGIQPFTFALMNVHVDPDDVEAEFAALQSIIGSVFPNHPGEDDFILLGDMNKDARSFSNFRWMSNQFAAIPNQWKTNTRQSESYDNFIFDAGRTSEFMNQSGVLNLLHEYGLTYDQARAVSDHMPVWAVFSDRESTATVLTQEPAFIR